MFSFPNLPAEINFMISEYVEPFEIEQGKQEHKNRMQSVHTQLLENTQMLKGPWYHGKSYVVDSGVWSINQRYNKQVYRLVNISTSQFRRFRNLMEVITTPARNREFQDVLNSI